jgi:hypothetical protein
MHKIFRNRMATATVLNFGAERTMTAKQIVERIPGTPDDNWSLAQCRVVELVGAEVFGLKCHARRADTGETLEFEIPISRQRAFRIASVQADGNADMLSWELNSVFAQIGSIVRLRRPV